MSELKARQILADAVAALGAYDDVRGISSMTALAVCRSARGPYTTELRSTPGRCLR
jgi:hypothetical protein